MQNKDKGDGIEDSPLDMLLVILLEGASKEVVTPSSSWAYLQAFRILCQSLYLELTPYAFLYFYDTRPRRPATWLSLISRPSISRLDAFFQSFKHFKDGYFKVVVKDGGKAHFLNANGSTKFPFSWTSNPSRYKDMGMDELSAGDKEVVEILLKFVDKLPTKGLVRVYNSVHPVIDIEGLCLLLKLC